MKKHEENSDLLKEFVNGSLEARTELIENNQGLVRHMALKFPNYDFNELISEGNIGLIKAIDTFDVSKKIKFATYAAACIRNEILMFIRKEKRQPNAVSLDQEFEPDNSYTLKDILMDKTIEPPEDKIILKEEEEQIIETLKVLNEREYTVIESRYIKNKTQKQIALQLNLSQSYISRIEQIALSKLKRHFELLERKSKMWKNLINKYGMNKINYALTLIDEKYQELIIKHHGLDLERFISLEALDGEERRELLKAYTILEMQIKKTYHDFPKVLIPKTQNKTAKSIKEDKSIITYGNKEIVKKEKSKPNSKKKGKKTFTTLMEFFNNQYTEEELLQGISFIKPEYSELIYLRYGTNLKTLNLDMSKEQIKNYYQNAIRNLKMILSQLKEGQEIKVNRRKPAKTLFNRLKDYNDEEKLEALSFCDEITLEALYLKYGKDLKTLNEEISEADEINFKNAFLRFKTILINIRKAKEQGIDYDSYLKLAKVTKKAPDTFEEYLKFEYTLEEIWLAISFLEKDSPKCLNWIYERYGTDLKTLNNNINENSKLNFYRYAIPKLMHYLEIIKSSRKIKTPEFSKEEVFNEILNMFNNPLIIEKIKTLPIKDCVVMSLLLGYVNGRCFTRAEVANFLDISFEEVVEIIERSGIILNKELNEIANTSKKDETLAVIKQILTIDKN